MKIVVTGNLGYIGNKLTPMLLKDGHNVVGLDAGYFPAFTKTDDDFPQITKDIRDVNRDDLIGADAVIHLAALSNDPTSELNKEWTTEINHKATSRLAKVAKDSGVRTFIFSSSCSVYGFADDIVNEESECNPISEYAKTKRLAEKDILDLNDDDFSAFALRNGTAYGASPRMRLDLVLNNLVAHAMAFGTIKILSDGTAWRPLVHISDISQAFMKILELDSDNLEHRVFNVGSNEQNVRVKEIAEAIKNIVPNTVIEFSKDAQKDKRSYRVDFTRISKIGFKARMNINDSIKEMQEFLNSLGMNKEIFRDRNFYNIELIKYMIENGQFDETLRIRKGFDNA